MSNVFRKRPLATAILASLAILAMAIAGLRSSTAQSHGDRLAAAMPQAMPVVVAPVVEREVAKWDEFSGRLEAVERVDVRSRVAGAIQSVRFTEGALVRRGEPLITIDPAPFAAEVDRAEAQVVAAKARLDEAASELERAKRLWQESAIAQRELDERVNGAKEAAANLRAAQATRQTARLNLDYTVVRAPVSGRVGKLEITVGNLVPAGPGAPVLTTIVSLNPIYASFDADEQVVERALEDLPHGAQVPAELRRIPVEMGTSSRQAAYHGQLQLVDNQVNARSGTVRLRAIFANDDGRLIPGQFATLRLGRARKENALLVSERAVGTDQDKKFVMVVGADNKATYREVTLGAAIDGLRIVTSGLHPGERIVVNGLQRVRPGTLVQPMPASATGSPAPKVHVAA